MNGPLSQGPIFQIIFNEKSVPQGNALAVVKDNEDRQLVKNGVALEAIQHVDGKAVLFVDIYNDQIRYGIVNVIDGGYGYYEKEGRGIDR